jgi:hypothetical protein
MATFRELGELQQRAKLRKLAATLTDELSATLDHYQRQTDWGSSEDLDEKTLWDLAVLDGLVDMLATHAAIMVIPPNAEGACGERLTASESIRNKFFPTIATMIKEEIARMKVQTTVR